MSPSYCWSRQAGYARRTPIDTWRAGTVGQRVACDLILPGKPDISLALRIGQEAVERAYSPCVAGDAVVQARHHHAASIRAFLVKLIELVAQRLLVSSRIPTREGKRHDVVQVKGIGDGDEVPPAHRDDERFVAARLVDMIEKTEVLQRLQDVDGVAHPIGVPADR